MNLMRKLPGSVREPAGLERSILRRLPVFLAAGTVIPVLCYVIAYLLPNPGPDASVEKYLTGVGIAAIAAVITVWTAAFTVAIGCLIVVVMKGPGYVADGYPLIDAAEPRRAPHPTSKAPPHKTHSSG